MTKNSNEIQIRELIEKWTKAAREKDINGAIASHTEDIVMFDVPKPIQSRGIAAYRKTWELFFDNSKGGQESFQIVESSRSLRAIQSHLPTVFCSLVPRNRARTPYHRFAKSRWRVACRP